MHRPLLAIVVLAVAVSFAAAEAPITIGERLSIHSKILGEERTLLLSPPRFHDRSTGRYPVLYLLDGERHLVHTRGTVDFLVANGLMPDVIIVGIVNSSRSRDLTPTNAGMATEDGRVIPIPASGGADAFLKFLVKELRPAIAKRYRTAPFDIVSGHSFGGLFALHTLINHSNAFDAYIALSPSLHWDDELPIRQAESFFDERIELRASLFVAIGDEVEPIETGYRRLVDILEETDIKRFRWQTMEFADEDHASVVLRGQYHGLRSVFDGWRLPVDPDTRFLTGTLDEVRRHYAELSDRLGFTIAPPEQVINVMGYEALFDQRIDDALRLFRYNVDAFPDSPNVHDSLGEGLENAGRLRDARASYRRAVRLGTAAGDPATPVYTRNLERVTVSVESKGAQDRPAPE